jgi:two-component system chemotaxis sensor kinase CheA
MIFDSGFSTAQVVSDISGRGVGMDMVRSSIEGVGGKILIDSKEGKGTSFTLTLPIPRSVLIIKSLMIKSKDSTFSIPLDDVAEVIRLEDYKENKIFHNIENSLILSHQDELLPLVDLNQILNNQKHYDQFEVMNIVVVRSEGYKYGIIVDEIMDIEEIVVKKMSNLLKEANCFLGITFIGHGALALILNLVSIAEKSHIKSSEHKEHIRHSDEEVDFDKMEFIQFNLRKSTNYAFPLNVVNRLEEIEATDVEFSGAIPLIRYRDSMMPLLFVERQLKMCSSKESLLDFYPGVMKVIVVNSQNKNFGIVVDEILDIGMSAETLNTQNIDRSEFVGTIFIDDRTVTIVDVPFLINNYIKFEQDIMLEESEASKENESQENWRVEKAA